MTIEKTNNYLISVICPVYNSKTKITRLLDSIDAQSYTRYEVVFVDDGSTDGTYEYLQRYSHGKGNIKVIKQKNAGPGIARKNGFKNCIGDLIYFIDSDDWLASADSLLRISELFSDDEKIDACIARRRVYPSNEIFGPFEISDLNFGVYDLDIFRGHLIYGNMSMKVFRRRVVSLNDFIGAFNFEDLATSYVIFDKCNRIKYLGDYFYVSNHAKDKKSLTTGTNYAINTLPERAENLITAMGKVRTSQIRAAIASAMFNTYCNFVSYGLVRKNKVLINELKENILRYDLSDFYRTYSLKKRFLLFLMRLWGRIG